jgi:hypothetical protein
MFHQLRSSAIGMGVGTRMPHRARMPHPARIADDHDGGNHLIHIYMFLEQRQRTTSDF